MTDRGRADPVSVEADLDPPAGTEYLPDEHAIRYVARVRAEDEDPPVRESAYSTRPFEDWAESECASLGRERVADAVESRLGDDQSAGSAVGQHPSGDGLAVTVEIRTMRDREGNVLSKPTIEYEELRDLTPESVTATIRYAGREVTETFPVVVREIEGQFL